MDEYKFYSYVDDKSILVITPKNKLVRIKCPFAVMDANENTLQVDAVVEISDTIHYKILGKAHSYSKFKIVYS